MPLSDAVIELRRRPIGDAALEVLLAMREGGIGIYQDRSYRIPEVSLYDPITLKSKDGFFSPSASARIGSVIDALVRREYVVLESARSFFEQLASEQPGKTFKPQKQNYIEQKFFKYRENKVDVFSITEDGIAAIRDMPARVAAYRNKRREEKYLITAKIQGKERVPGVGGIYRIEKETADRILVSNQEIEGAVKFAHDPALKYSQPRGSQTVYFVQHKDVLLEDATPHQFNQLWERYAAYLVDTQNFKEELDIRVLALQREHQAATQTLDNRLQAFIENFVEQNQPNQVDEHNDTVAMDDEEIEGFTP